MNECVKGYKVFNPDWTCRDKQYSCPGKFEEDLEPTTCKKGMHFCERLIDCFDYYSFNPKNKVAKVRAYGVVARYGDKSCTNKLEIVRELTWDEVLNFVNTGNCNTGNRNTGNCNTGNRNTGDWNTGNCNTGNCNTGNRNTGDWNTGDRNTGNRNTGDWNTGDRNTGDWNTGDRNTGDWNTGDRNTGCFNTTEDKIRMFNQPSNWTYDDWINSDARYLLSNIRKDLVEWICESDMNDKEKSEHPEHVNTGGYLKVLDESECAQIWWDELSVTDKDIIKSMPNFDKDIFEEVVGIKMEG